jgi:branched-chain amino acid transport system substrate-binding protein
VVVLAWLENQQMIGEYLNSRKVPNVEIQTPANLSQKEAWSFGVTVDHAVQGKLVADYFVKVLKAKNVGIVSENTPTLDPGRKAFTKEIAKLHAKVSYAHTVEGQQNDFSNEALALKSSGANAVWLYMAPTPAAALANQSDAAGFHPTWFANSISWAFDLVFGIGPDSLKGARAFSPWLPLSDPRTDAYKKAFSDQNPDLKPDDLGIIGWGVGQIVAEGLRNAKPTLGQNSFRDAMQHLQFRPDIWAPLDFRPGVRGGANVVAVLRQDGDHWQLEHDFTGSF